MDRTRIVRTLGLGLLLGLYACGSADPSDSDTRLGEQGKVKFTGGGGCNGSTTLAAGSKAELTREMIRFRSRTAIMQRRRERPPRNAGAPR